MLAFGASPVFAAIFSSGYSINSTFKYAWSDKAGWINFNPNGGNVVITGTQLTGYIWSQNYGWINLSPTKGGVLLNSGNGLLSGYAWGQNVGWINFDGVAISCYGRFTGSATGDIVGTITFGTDKANSDDQTRSNVRTDWTPSDVCGITVPPHNICNELNQCVSVSGSGTDQCSSSADCVHYTCSKKIVSCVYGECTGTCVPIDGPGTSDCSLNSDCKGDPYAVVKCVANGNCGDDGFTGDKSCVGNEVWQNHQIWTCNDKGKVTSSCTSAKEPERIEVCDTGKICVAGGSCATLPCFFDSDCGSNEYVYGTESCVGNEVHQDYKTWRCNDPGKSSSSCTFTTAPSQLKKTCDAGQTCSRGDCVTLPCGSNLDCGTDGFDPDDSPRCDNGNVVQNYITHICNLDSTCSSVTNQANKEVCTTGCKDNSCCTPSWHTDPWEECVDGKTTRKVYDENNCGTVVGEPISAQDCTLTCTPSWKCDFNTCLDGVPTATCSDSNNCETEMPEGLNKKACPSDEACLNGLCCKPDWKKSAWSDCENGYETRTVEDANNCETALDKPATTQACTKKCEPNWNIGGWGKCVDGQQTRNIIDLSGCGLPTLELTAQACAPDCSPHIVIGDWGECVDGQQTRTVEDASGCKLPITEPTSQACTEYCTPNWVCGAFTACVGNSPIRACTDLNDCKIEADAFLTIASCPADQACSAGNCIPAKKIDTVTAVTKAVTTAVRDVVKETKKIIVSPEGEIITKTISTTGSAVATVVTASSIFSFSFYEMFLSALRLLGLLGTALGLKKKALPWGVAYDSVTKQPLDPAYITLTNIATGNVFSAITDIDGRYGFLVEPGAYQMSVKKTNYSFPSQKLAGKVADELHADLYFGEKIEIKKYGEVITKNIPMDPVKFDWNEFAKKDKGLMKFYSKWDVVLKRVYDLSFIIGFGVAVLAYIFAPYPYNTIIMLLYVFLVILRVFGVKPKSFGSVIEKETGIPLSFAIVRVMTPDSNIEIAAKSADQYGRYYCLVPPGKYYVKIEKKNEDGSYSLVYTSEVINVFKKGIIKERFRI